VSNVFAAAAFRFGHTLVANHLESYDKHGARTGAVPITRTQFEPYAMYDNTTVAAYVRGLTTQPSQAFDTAFAAELTGHLFQAALRIRTRSDLKFKNLAVTDLYHFRPG
jgi:peroxidase